MRYQLLWKSRKETPQKLTQLGLSVYPRVAISRFALVTNVRFYLSLYLRKMSTISGEVSLPFSFFVCFHFLLFKYQRLKKTEFANSIDLDEVAHYVCPLVFELSI